MEASEKPCQDRALGVIDRVELDGNGGGNVLLPERRLHEGVDAPTRAVNLTQVQVYRTIKEWKRREQPCMID